MRNKILLLTLLLFTIILIGTKSGLAQTNVTDCINITSGGEYDLNQSINGVQASNKCIDIQADDVLLDCMGFSLDYNDSAGSIAIAGNGTDILFNPLRNVTIQNCVVTDYAIGIALNKTDGGVLDNNVLTSNDDSGMKFVDIRNVNLTNNDIESNTFYGIYGGMDSNNFIGNTMNLNGITGLWISGNANTINNNNASLNGQYGIYIISYDPTFALNNVTSNNASYNNETGIYVTLASWNYIDYNIADNNTGTGIALIYVNNTELIGNNITLNGDAGITIQYGVNNSIMGNTISNSTNDGIFIMSAINTIIDGNTISDNNWDFDSWTGCSGTLATNNIFGSSFPTTTNFTYSGQIAIKGVTSQPTNPDFYQNIGKYINAIDLASGAWLALNISYLDGDLVDVNESLMNMSRFIGGWITDSANFSNNYGLDVDNNYVYANITGLGSGGSETIFAPLGLTAVTSCPMHIYINGAEVQNFTNSGEPYNVTVTVSNGTSLTNANVTINETSGYSIFSMAQWQNSPIPTIMSGIIATGDTGIVSFTVVPTGGIGVDESSIGNYNITVAASINGYTCNTTSLQVTNRNLPTPTPPAQVPNLNNILYFKDKMAIAYLRIKDWLAVGGGEWNDVTVYTNGTVVGLPSNPIAGKPYGLNVTLRNATTLSPISGVDMQIVEKNGYPPFILPQFWTSNVTNYAYGLGHTNANGNFEVTVVPTGGVGIDSIAIGGYSVKLVVPDYNISADFTCAGADCNFPVVSGTGVALPNHLNIQYFKDKIALIYLRVKGWIS